MAIRIIRRPSLLVTIELSSNDQSVLGIQKAKHIKTRRVQCSGLCARFFAHLCSSRIMESKAKYASDKVEVKDTETVIARYRKAGGTRMSEAWL